MLQPQFSIVYDLIDHTDHRNGIQSTRRRRRVGPRRVGPQTNTTY